MCVRVYLYVCATLCGVNQSEIFFLRIKRARLNFRILPYIDLFDEVKTINKSEHLIQLHCIMTDRINVN